MLYALYKIEWTEYERGWGNRPDGTTYYPTKELAEKAVTDYWARMPKETPDCYSSPSEPVLVEVNEELYNKTVAAYQPEAVYTLVPDIKS